MADYSEDVALFTKPKNRSYTGPNTGAGGPEETDEHPRRESDSDVDQGQSYQSSHDRSQGQDPSGASQDQGQGQTQTQQGQRSRREDEEEMCAITPFDLMLSEVHDRAMGVAGFGPLQWILFVILGLGLMGDGIELLMIAYILPGAEKDLCMDEQMKGWLGELTVNNPLKPLLSCTNHELRVYYIKLFSTISGVLSSCFVLFPIKSYALFAKCIF